MLARRSLGRSGYPAPLPPVPRPPEEHRIAGPRWLPIEPQASTRWRGRLGRWKKVEEGVGEGAQGRSWSGIGAARPALGQRDASASNSAMRSEQLVRCTTGSHESSTGASGPLPPHQVVRAAANLLAIQLVKLILLLQAKVADRV